MWLLYHRCKNFLHSYLHSKEGKYIRALREILGYTPLNLSLYRTAFTHSSLNHLRGVRSHQPVKHNERLEFLGDAVIGAIVSEYLYKKFPKQREGFLTQLRSKIVGRDALSALAWEIGLAKFIKAHLNKPLSRNILGNTLEAFVGAIYLDKGYACAKETFLKRIFLARVDVDELIKHEFDYKSRLLEIVQKQGYSAHFETFQQAQRNAGGELTFSSTLHLNDELAGSGSGRSKKEAEQRAAEQAYNKLTAAV